MLHIRQCCPSLSWSMKVHDALVPSITVTPCYYHPLCHSHRALSPPPRVVITLHLCHYHPFLPLPPISATTVHFCHYHPFLPLPFIFAIWHHSCLSILNTIRLSPVISATSIRFCHHSPSSTTTHFCYCRPSLSLQILRDYCFVSQFAPHLYICSCYGWTQDTFGISEWADRKKTSVVGRDIGSCYQKHILLWASVITILSVPRTADFFRTEKVYFLASNSHASQNCKRRNIPFWIWVVFSWVSEEKKNS